MLSAFSIFPRLLIGNTYIVACAEDIGLQLADGSSASRHARVLLLPTRHCTTLFSGGRCSGCLPCPAFPVLTASVLRLSAQCSPKHNGSSCPHLLPPLSPINNPAKTAAPASHLRRLTPKLLPPIPDRHSRARQPKVSLNFGNQHQRVHRRLRIHTVATLPRSQGPKDRPTHESQLDRPAISSACRHRYLPPTGLVALHHCHAKLQQPTPARQTAERRPLVGGRLDRRYVL